MSCVIVTHEFKVLLRRYQMKTCARCGTSLRDNDKFCPSCGLKADSKSVVTYEQYEGHPFKCPECGEILVFENPFDVICTSCGKYVGFNANTLNSKLIKLAVGWEGDLNTFLDEIFKNYQGSTLAVRAKAALKRKGLTPVQVLGIHTTLSRFGTKMYSLLEAARNNWRPKPTEE
jgi:hypothetical protein